MAHRTERLTAIGAWVTWMTPNLQTPVGNQSRVLMKMRLIRPLPLLAGAWLAGVPLHTAGAAQTPKAGAAAPLVQGTDQDGKTWKLADVVGKKVVLNTFSCDHKAVISTSSPRFVAEVLPRG